MRSFFASLISGLNYFCVDSVQKPSTLKPPHRPRCPGRSMLDTLFPGEQNPLTAFCGMLGRLMQLIPADAEAGWRVSSAWLIHTALGVSSTAWQWAASFPQHPAAPLTSGPLQLPAQNEVCGDTCTARGGDYAALPVLLSQIFPPCRCVGSIHGLARRSGREMLMCHGTPRSLGRNLPSSLPLSLLQPGSNLLMGFTSSSSWAVLVALLEDGMRVANSCLVPCGCVLPRTGNLAIFVDNFPCSTELFLNFTVCLCKLAVSLQTQWFNSAKWD